MTFSLYNLYSLGDYSRHIRKQVVFPSYLPARVHISLFR